MDNFESLNKEKLVELYTNMLKIRKFEETTSNLFAEGLIPGLVHLYTGEEAVAVGACANLRKDDYVVSTHRGHGHCIAKGGDLKKMMAELLGKETGYSKGRGGSMHMIAPEIGVMGSSGIVGAGIPIATGLGLAIDLQRADQVVVCFFGDGATNTGTFHEGLNLTAVWKLPVVFICENNLYAISMPLPRATLVQNIADRGVAYGIPSVTVDGMDVIATYNAAQEAVKRAREGKGPTLIECKTYRYRGHFEGDPKRGTTYRSETEILEWEKKCPINAFATRLIEKGIVTAEELSEIEQKCIKDMEEAVEFAKNSQYPSQDQISDNVFV